MISIIIPTCPGNEEVLEKCINSIIRNTSEKEYNLIVVKNDYIGFAKAVNRGLDMAGRNQDIILLNDDTQVIEGWIEEFKEVVNQYDIIGCNRTLRPHHIPFWGVYIKKEVINKIGLLDEDFEIGEWEDVDFCIRAIDAGFKLGETKHTLIMHLSPSTTLRNLTQEQENKRIKNKEIFWNKIKEKPKWRKTFEHLEGEIKEEKDG
jgi:GT2 family glycosyltransferase